MLPLTLLVACAQEPLMVEVTNESGAALTLEWVEHASGETVSVVVPVDGARLEYTGAPPRGGSVDVEITAVGAWATGSRVVLDHPREDPLEVAWTQDDITNFELLVTSEVALDSFYIKSNLEGAIADGEEPGSNYGPVSAGASRSISRAPIDEGFAWVARSAEGEAKGVITGTEHWKGMTINLDLSQQR